MEKKLWSAAKGARELEVKEILRNNPTIDVNWKNDEEMGWTALHQACACGLGHELIMSILLTHPDIDVNSKKKDGWTPSC